jgi:hypothetical protein
MGSMDFKMMMESGVLRPGDIAIRRGPGGLPLYAIGELPDFLNHSLDVLFGPHSDGPCATRPQEAKRPTARERSSARLDDSTSSLKTMMVRLGLFHEDTKPSMSRQPPLPNPTATLEKRVQILESLLKEEHARCEKQVEELAILRFQLKSIDELQADLTIEREAGKQLVQWLQEAERKLAETQGRRLTLVGGPPRKTSYFPEDLNKEKVQGIFNTK